MAGREGNRLVRHQHLPKLLPPLNELRLRDDAPSRPRQCSCSGPLAKDLAPLEGQQRLGKLARPKSQSPHKTAKYSSIGIVLDDAAPPFNSAVSQ
jgi:hypothetical protein